DAARGAELEVYSDLSWELLPLPLPDGIVGVEGCFRIADGVDQIARYLEGPVEETGADAVLISTLLRLVRHSEKGAKMSGVRLAVLAAVSAFVLAMSASAGATGNGNSSATVTSGSAGAGTADCLAHIPAGLSANESDLSEYYTAICTGHD